MQGGVQSWEQQACTTREAPSEARGGLHTNTSAVSCFVPCGVSDTVQSPSVSSGFFGRILMVTLMAWESSFLLSLDMVLTNAMNPAHPQLPEDASDNASEVHASRCRGRTEHRILPDVSSILLKRIGIMPICDAAVVNSLSAWYVTQRVTSQHVRMGGVRIGDSSAASERVWVSCRNLASANGLSTFAPRRG